VDDVRFHLQWTLPGNSVRLVGPEIKPPRVVLLDTRKRLAVLIRPHMFKHALVIKTSSENDYARDRFRGAGLWIWQQYSVGNLTDQARLSEPRRWTNTIFPEFRLRCEPTSAMEPNIPCIINCE